MKIAFIGDSFCAYPFFESNRPSSASLASDGTSIRQDEYRPYQYLVAQEYDAEIIAIGRASGCLYHSYEDLLKVVDEVDYIVFCITDPHRLVNRHKLGLNHSSVKQYATTGRDFSSLSVCGENTEYFTSLDLEDKPSPPKKLLDNIYNAANNYFEFLYFDDFHEFVQIRILEQLDMLMLQMRIRKKKKCIWFPCFDYSMQGYIPKSGPIADTVLITISDAELKKLHPRPRGAFDITDPRLNHFNEENNRNMARLIIDIIKKDNFSPYEIKMEDYFEVLK